MTAVGLTPRQKTALDFITSYIAEKGYSPSFDDIKHALGLHSKSGVHRLVHGLKERGHITLRRNQSRSITLGGADYRAMLRRLALHVQHYEVVEAHKLASEVLVRMGEAQP